MRGEKVNVVLKRCFEKGKLCFELPESLSAQEQLRSLLTICKTKYNDFVSVTLDKPKKPRTTGKYSQNHHLNGHIVQICNHTGHSYDEIKYCVKMIAIEVFGYPYTQIAGHIVPKRERDCSTEECAKLIEGTHLLAEQLEIMLEE